MKNVTQQDIAILLAAVENSDEVCPLSPAQMRSLRGGVSRGEYCETARTIVLNNDVEGNTGLETVWNECHKYWARHAM